MSKPVSNIVFSRVGGFIFFLVILGIANILVNYVDNLTFKSVVYFFNFNLILLFVLMLIGMINEIFWGFYFPFNALAPVSSAILSVFVVIFFFRIWNFIDVYANTGINLPIIAIYVPLALFVFFTGFLIIVIRGGKPKGEYKNKVKRKAKSDLEWKDVEEEFKLFFYNIGKSLNKLFEKKSKS